MKKKVLFLINPVSGIGKQRAVERFIESEIDKSRLDVDVSYTQYKAHARVLAGEAAGIYDVVVAVGGDGTVNEVSSKLIDTNTALAIIPTGSGNGLARYLNIPLNVKNAVRAINDLKIRKIDSLKVNQYCCVNVAGIGFDAHISHQFEGKKMRGPIGYLQLITTEYATYKSDNYLINIDGKKFHRNAFLISLANSSQYGNNIHIAPNAKIDDGFIDVSIVRDFPKIIAPAMLLSLLDKSLDKNNNNEVIRAKRIDIEHRSNILAHIDGEPVELGKKAEIEIKPLSLNVVVPPEGFHIDNSIWEPIKELIPKLKDGMSLEQIWHTKKEN